MQSFPTHKELVILRYRHLTLRTNKFRVEIILAKRSSTNAVKNKFLLQFNKQVHLLNESDLLITSIEKISNKNFLIRFQIHNLEQNYSRLNLSTRLNIFCQNAKSFVINLTDCKMYIYIYYESKLSI